MRGFNKFDVGKFVYSAYWGTWDKVVAFRDIGNYGGWEVDVVQLTPVNGDWKGDSLLGKVRTHATDLSSRDKVVDRLPPEVEAKVREHNLGKFL